MNLYTFTEARQNLASVLKVASETGEVRIKRRNGSVFIVKPQTDLTSPLDVKGINLDINSDEIVKIVRESRQFYDARITSKSK